MGIPENFVFDEEGEVTIAESIVFPDRGVVPPPKPKISLGENIPSL